MYLYALCGYQLWSDGCTGIPSGRLLPACLLHDLDYSIGGNHLDKEMADQRFIKNTQDLGSVVRSYWFEFILNKINDNSHWGDSTIKTAPDHPNFFWRKPGFNINDLIWFKLT